MLPCLAPSWPQIMQIRISFRSRSDLVLDADHALDFLSYLVYIRVPRFVVFQTSGASMFWPCLHKNVIAHMISKDFDRNLTGLKVLNRTLAGFNWIVQNLV